MATSTVIAIYFIIWWVVLFAVLPWGVHSQQESGEVAPGTDPGAPAVHRIGMKLIYTTAVASVVFGILYGVYVLDLIPYEFLKQIFKPPHS
jgi:predicted secreted protein